LEINNRNWLLPRCRICQWLNNETERKMEGLQDTGRGWDCVQRGPDETGAAVSLINNKKLTGGWGWWLITPGSKSKGFVEIKLVDWTWNLTGINFGLWDFRLSHLLLLLVWGDAHCCDRR